LILLVSLSPVKNPSVSKFITTFGLSLGVMNCPLIKLRLLVMLRVLSAVMPKALNTSKSNTFNGAVPETESGALP